MVHFPPGVNITYQGLESCTMFCSYHNSFKLTGKDIHYAVIPDLGGVCAGGCGNGTQLQNETQIASKELLNSITDPAPGDIPGWYDQNYGDIADYCLGEAGQVDNWTVQLGWSNAAHACVATRNLTCAHNKCSTGSDLVYSCDPCVSEICNVDPGCCTNFWSSTCVQQVHTVCGETCP
jgi:hypothetical protein